MWCTTIENDTFFIRYAKGTVIIQQGDVGKKMFMIQQGHVYATVAQEEEAFNEVPDSVPER